MPELKKEPAPKPVLGSAGASTDPAVQDLLAHYEIAERNGDAAVKQRVVSALAALGYEL